MVYYKSKFYKCLSETLKYTFRLNCAILSFKRALVCFFTRHGSVLNFVYDAEAVKNCIAYFLALTMFFEIVSKIKVQYFLSGLLIVLVYPKPLPSEWTIVYKKAVCTLLLSLPPLSKVGLLSS